MRVAAASLILVACSGRAGGGRVEAPPAERIAARAGAESDWADATRSPWPSASTEPPCGEPDGALERVARKIVEQRARGLGMPDPDDVVAWLRTSGEPHPRPRIVRAGGRAPIDEHAFAAELAAMRTPVTRCGVARARTADGGEIAAAVVVDALADLAPIPTRARTGQWLTFEARLRAPADDVRLVVLGPRGLPRTVTTSFDPTTRAVRARFVLDRPGAFTVQLVGDVASGGPRPLLEAHVFADVEPKAEQDAPGEATVDGEDLAALVAAARAEESLPPLVRDGRLDALAQRHAEDMRAAREIAHDLGDGDLRARFAAAGLDAQRVGENVARAASVARVHRALWASPSHRLELLRAEYTHIGIGLARDGDGTVYACEVFARDPR